MRRRSLRKSLASSTQRWHLSGSALRCKFFSLRCEFCPRAAAEAGERYRQWPLFRRELGAMTVIRSWARTDVGKRRKHNEDAFLNDDELGLYVVADGLGGHAAGGVARAQAVTPSR